MILLRAIIELLIPDEPGDVRVNENRRKYRMESPEEYQPVDVYIEEHPDEREVVKKLIKDAQCYSVHVHKEDDEGEHNRFSEQVY